MNTFLTEHLPVTAFYSIFDKKYTDILVTLSSTYLQRGLFSVSKLSSVFFVIELYGQINIS